MFKKQEQEPERRAISEISLDAQMLYDRIIKLDVGQGMTYEELSGIIGRDVQVVAYSVLKTARDKAEREDQKCFAVIPKVGLKRLDDRGIVSAGEGYIGKIRKMSRRGSRKLTCVKDFAALPKEDQLKHNVSLSLLGAMEQFSGAPAIKRLAGKVASTQGVLPSALAIRAAFE